MPTPLPAIMPPDYAPTLNAYRTGVQDRIAQDERNLLKEAGGLAAAGNMSGAQSALYKGGNFGEARNIAQELRAQSAENRAATSHARVMKDADLERSAKTYELFGRLIPTITSPEQLELAKGLIKQRTGMDLSSVTMEQLPMLRQQNLSIEQQLNQELSERRFKAEEARANQAQANTDRAFNFQTLEAQRAQGNADRTFEAGRSDAAAMQDFRADQLKVMADRAKAQALKANAPKPLTEGQASAQYFHGTMKQAEDNLAKLTEENNKMPPLSSRALSIYMNTPTWAQSPLLNKRERAYLQAMDQWIRAKLRKESGATIGSDEIRGEISTFIPLSTDSGATRLQKNNARAQILKGFRTMGAMDGGRGAPEMEPASDDENDFKVLNVE